MMYMMVAELGASNASVACPLCTIHFTLERVHYQITLARLQTIDRTASAPVHCLVHDPTAADVTLSTVRAAEAVFEARAKGNAWPALIMAVGGKVLTETLDELASSSLWLPLTGTAFLFRKG